jgi:hypothetical protein
MARGHGARSADLGTAYLSLFPITQHYSIYQASTIESANMLMAEPVQHVVRDGRTWRRAPRPISSPGAPHCTAAGSILVRRRPRYRSY